MRLTDYEKNILRAGSFSNFSPMRSLVELMGKMTAIITEKNTNLQIQQNGQLSDASGCGSASDDDDGNGENVFERDDLISIFKNSLPTSNVHLKAEQKSREMKPLFRLGFLYENGKKW